MTTIDPNAQNTPGTQTSVLDSLVGPGKKFGDTVQLAAGKIEADKFIEKLKSEKQDLANLVTTLESENATLKATTSILDRLDLNQRPATQQAPITQVNNEPSLKPGMTADDVIKLVDERDVRRQAQNNKAEVDRVLVKQLGSNAQAFVIQKAEELGIASADLVNLAYTSPKAFYSMLGIDPAQNPNSTAYVPGTRGGTPTNRAEVRNNTYYEKIKQEKGIRAFILDTKLQQQMYRDLNALGDAFYA
jgi:hypothetical protein